MAHDEKRHRRNLTPQIESQADLNSNIFRTRYDNRYRGGGVTRLWREENKETVCAKEEVRGAHVRVLTLTALGRTHSERYSLSKSR
jgi:hypothetical protein